MSYLSEAVQLEHMYAATKAATVARDTHAWETAQKDSLRRSLASLPDAREYAYELPLPVAEALLRASPSRSFMRGASPADLKLLRAYGLAEYGGNCLTNYGIAVRREIAG